MNKQTDQPGLFIGIDWADQKLDIYVINRNRKAFHRELMRGVQSSRFRDSS